MSELNYYTRRQIDSGKAELWVFKQKCDCGGMFHKPKKTSLVYVCDSCGAEVEKAEYEAKQIANIQYTCPKCNHTDGKQVPFNRKKVTIVIKGKNKRVEACQFECDSCKEKINVTKKLK